MTFVSLAQATRRLGIDAKTLHRWLADAQLALQSHPHDGRKKGVSDEHLQMLARLHQRSLASAQEEGPAQLPCQIPALPADLLSLPEQLSALQAHLVTLQQQVAALTRLMTQHRPEPAIPPSSVNGGRFTPPLMTQHRPEPAIPLAPTRPTSTAKPPPKPPRSRPAASVATKTPPKPTHVLPRVEYGREGRYVVICPKKGLLPLEPDTQEWFAWVAEQDAVRFVGRSGYFTAHHEWRVPPGLHG